MFPYFSLGLLTSEIKKVRIPSSFIQSLISLVVDFLNLSMVSGEYNSSKIGVFSTNDSMISFVLYCSAVALEIVYPSVLINSD